MDGFNSRQDISNQAYESIKEMILTLKLIPGSHLSDYLISKEMGISRTPVRQALNNLFNDGLLTIINNKWVVSYISLNDIKEIMQARYVIESTCATNAIQADKSKELTIGLVNLLDHQQANSKKQKDYELDADFHLKIVRAGQNSRLESFYEKLKIQSARFYWLTSIDDSWKSHTIQEHKLIIEGFNNADSKLTCDAIATHLAMTENNYIRILKSSPLFNVISNGLSN